MRKFIVALLLAVSARSGSAQAVRGAVVNQDNTPVSGVVVALVDAQFREVARALTDDRGEYRLIAPAAGTYRLRTRRIGFQPVVTEPIAVTTDGDVTRRLAVSTLVFSLDTVRSVGRNDCRVIAGDSISLVAAVWDQVRSALAATLLSTRLIQTTTVSYQRMLGVRSKRVGSQSSDVRAEFGKQPWRSLSADSLRRFGYVVTEHDGSRVYYSPDLAALLSDEFVEDHCFRLSRASDDRRLGIDFEPTPARKNIADIRGTVWLDRKTNALVGMEHGYTGGVRADEAKLAGGEMGFARLENGMWAISRWSIHMPVQRMAPVYSNSFSVLRYEPKVDSIRVTGGDLIVATTMGTRRDTVFYSDSLALVAPRVSATRVVAEPAVPTVSDSTTRVVAPAAAQSPSRDSVVGSAGASDPLMGEFEQNRRAGQGRFLSREEIERRRAGTTASLLQALPGLRIASSQAGDFAQKNERCNGLDSPRDSSAKGWSGGRGGGCTKFYMPPADEVRRGVSIGCYSRIYIDQVLMNPGTPTPPYDLRELSPAEIQGIEYYSEAAEMPVKYRGLSASCGLVIFHTRRSVR